MDSLSYFQVISKEANSGRFRLLSTNAEVHISGLIAEVAVEQVYHNPGTQPLEAIYVFPRSTQAAINAMEMHMGSRKLKAQIKEKNQARALYEKAQALVEQK